MDPSKITEARKAGYSDAEIADFLATSDPKIQQARDAGYKDEEIVGHLAGPGPSLASRALDAVGDGYRTATNYRDTQFAKAMGGLAGLPRMVAEGIHGAADAAGHAIGAMGPEESTPNPLSFLPSAESSTKFMLDRAKVLPGFKETDSGSPIVDAGVQSLFSGPVMGAGGRFAPFINAGGGMGSEAAKEFAEGTPWEIPARLAGGLLGGAGAGIGAVAVGKAVRGAKAAVAPFTATGRDAIVGNTLNTLADDAPKAAANMEAYTPPVPGFRISAAKASRDDALMGVQNALDRPGTGFGQRVNSNNAVLTEALNKLDAGADPRAFVADLAKQDAGAAMHAQAALDALPQGASAEQAGTAIRNALRGRYDNLATARSNATRPLYEAARSDETPLKPFPLLASTTDAVAGTKGDLQATAKKVRGLLFDAGGKADRTAPGMMATRDAVGDMLSNATPKQKNMLMGFKGDIDDVLSAVPAERQARQTYAEMSKPLDAFSAEAGNPFAANVIEKDQFGKDFMLPSEKVPTQFFRAGDAGAATMKEFLAANDGHPGAIASMRGFIADKARAAPDIKAFLRQNRPAIETLDPALARQLEDAVTTRTLSTGFQASPASKFINGDLDAAVKSTLGAPDSVKRLQSLRMSVGGSPAAVTGMQKAVLDDFRGKALATVAEDGSGNARLTANGAESWLKANRGAVANVLTPDQVAGLDAISRALKDQAQTAVKVAGSDTGRNLATQSIVDALFWKGAGDAAWLAPLRKTLGLVYGGANEKALQRLTDVMLEPKIAAALMKKATPGNVSMTMPLLARHLAEGTRTAAEADVGAVSRSDERRSQ